MSDKPIFNPSGHIKDTSDIKDIEVWGHDAGEFSLEEDPPPPPETEDES